MHEMSCPLFRIPLCRYSLLDRRNIRFLYGSTMDCTPAVRQRQLGQSGRGFGFS